MTRIITKEVCEDGERINVAPTPDWRGCKKKAEIFDVLDRRERADGILISILKYSDGKVRGIRIGKYKAGQAIAKGFVITREALSGFFLRGRFNSLHIMVCAESKDYYIIVFGADHSCAEGGGGSEGTKVRIPNRPPAN